MSAIRHIKAASEHITKQSFGSAKTPRKAYVNPLGQSILSELDSLRVELQKQGEILQSMEPLRETAVAIRRRFYHNSSNITERGMGRHGVEPITGNAAAREGNVVTDTIMISRGELPYPNTFHRLYGIEHTIASAYFGIYPFAILTLIYTNKFRFPYLNQNLEQAGNHARKPDPLPLGLA